MAVEQQHSSGSNPRMHSRGFAGIDLDYNKAQPRLAVSLRSGLELLQQALAELEDFFDVDAGNLGASGGDGCVGQQDVFKFIFARGQDGGALVDLGRIEQVEDGEVLHGQNSAHTFEAEAALLVEKIGDVSLPEAGLLGEPESGQFACLDSFPQYLAKIFLQDF